MYKLIIFYLIFKKKYCLTKLGKIIFFFLSHEDKFHLRYRIECKTFLK